jgi:hypothetical protein
MIPLRPDEKVCPKTGKVIKPAANRKNAFFIMPLVAGLAALVWFCIRVIPKPSRIHHPCQRVAAPLASGFLLWIASFAAGVAIFRKGLSLLKRRRFIIGAVCFVMALSFILVSTIPSARPAFSLPTKPALSTLPIGVAKGIYPGRVVWVRDASALNQSWAYQSGGSDHWWMDKNSDQTKIDQMVSKALQRLTGTVSDSLAWVALFKYFNKQKYGLDNTGYKAGEKIVIKINLSSASSMDSSGGNYTKTDPTRIDMTDTSPQMMRALLKQLINAAHVAPTDIYIGDPNKPFFQQFFSLVQPSFPKVNYIDAWGKSGRMPAKPTASPVLFYSDGKLNYSTSGGDPRQPSDNLPQLIVDARYLISLSPMKGHEAAGVTGCTKNHFGTQSRQSAWTKGQGYAYHLHYALPFSSPGYGQYRNLVDLMGHKDIGGKTMLSVLDGLWAGHTSTCIAPNKWVSMGNAYPASIFLSQDIVAIEAVMVDFLKEEYRTPNYTAGDHLYPNTINGVDDYLYQAADPVNWPATVGGQKFPGYDPESDGTFIASLGTFDRWNNPTAKQYSRNLDPVNGKGIELVKLTPDFIVSPVKAAPAKVLAKSDSRVYAIDGRVVPGRNGSSMGARGEYLLRDANGQGRKAVLVGK